MTSLMASLTPPDSHRRPPLWTHAQLSAAFTHVEPLVSAWVVHEQTHFDEALARIRRRGEAHGFRQGHGFRWEPIDPDRGAFHSGVVDELLEIVRTSFLSLMRMRLPDALMINGLRRLVAHTDDAFAGLAAAITEDLVDAAAVRASAQNVAGVGPENGSALSTALSVHLSSAAQHGALPPAGAGAMPGGGGSSSSGGGGGGGGGGVGGGDAGGGTGGVGGGSFGWLTRQVIATDCH